MNHTTKKLEQAGLLKLKKGMCAPDKIAQCHWCSQEIEKEKIGSMNKFIIHYKPNCDPEFAAAQEDEDLAGAVYDSLPKFRDMNQVNRKAWVHGIAEVVRKELRKERLVIISACEGMYSHSTGKGIAKAIRKFRLRKKA